MKGLVYKAAGQVLMRGHGRLCRKVFYFLIFGIAHLLYYMQCPTASDVCRFLSAEVTFLRRLFCAVGKTAQKVVRRVLSRAPKERAATVRRHFLLCGLFICGKFSPRAFILRPLKRLCATGQGVVCNAAKVCVESRLSASVAGAR